MAEMDPETDIFSAFGDAVTFIINLRKIVVKPNQIIFFSILRN